MLVCLCVHAGSVWRTARGPSHIHGVPGAWVTRTLEWRVFEWKSRGLPVVLLDMSDAMTDACAGKGGGGGRRGGSAGDGEGRRKCWLVCAGGTERGVTGPRQQETVQFCATCHTSMITAPNFSNGGILLWVVIAARRRQCPDHGTRKVTILAHLESRTRPQGHTSIVRCCTLQAVWFRQSGHLSSRII